MVEASGKAKEPQGKVEHHAKLFELMRKDVLAEVQPQTEYEWRECFDAWLVVGFWCLSGALCLPSGRHGCNLAHDERRRHSWQGSFSSLETWNMHGAVRGDYWIALSAEQHHVKSDMRGDWWRPNCEQSW